MKPRRSRRFRTWIDPITKREHLNYDDQLHAVIGPKGDPGCKARLLCPNCEKELPHDGAPALLHAGLIVMMQRDLEGGNLAFDFDPANMGLVVEQMLSPQYSDAVALAVLAEHLADAVEHRHFIKRRRAGA
jgi:hypothetical protein